MYKEREKWRNRLRERTESEIGGERKYDKIKEKHERERARERTKTIRKTN